MSTELKIIYTPFRNAFKTIPKKIETQYFTNSPIEILKELAPEYKISKFKDISTDIFPRELKGNWRTQGIEITDFINPQLKATQSFEEFQTFNPQLLKYSKEIDKQEIVNSFIRKYLIKKEIKKAGKTISIGRIPKTIEKGEYSYINYFQTRITTPDPKKELYLKEIIDYSKAIFENDNFDIGDLEKITIENIKLLPKEFDALPEEIFQRISKISSTKLKSN